jgi:uncharacterized RDD family membrane protein YckC
MVSPPVEGALAPKTEPLREIPGLRKKEKERSWREEVNERVRSRRRKRPSATSTLPLFEGVPDPEPAAAQAIPPAEAGRTLPEEPSQPVDRFGSEEPVADIPLRSPETENAEPAARDPEARTAASPLPPARKVELGDEEPPVRPADEEWPLELQPPPAEGRPLERPAYLGERLRAGALDVALLLGLWGIVVYFASRAAHVPLSALRPTWPWLGGYLASLGLAYAAYFTGTTGQTLGKIALGLRVVDTAGQPPGYFRALARALVGSLGVLAVGLGLLPMAFDPARRAFHDRIFRLRVVRG